MIFSGSSLKVPFLSLETLDKAKQSFTLGNSVKLSYTLWSHLEITLLFQFTPRISHDISSITQEMPCHQLYIYIVYILWNCVHQNITLRGRRDSEKMLQNWEKVILIIWKSCRTIFHDFSLFRLLKCY